jgi:hypothetical protein
MPVMNVVIDFNSMDVPFDNNVGGVIPRMAVNAEYASIGQE